MSILYKPVKIESAAQAEALPEGAIMFLPAGPYVWTAREPGGEFLDHYGRPWHFENTQDDEPFTALVPLEAEEAVGAGGAGLEQDVFDPRILLTLWVDVLARADVWSHS